MPEDPVTYHSENAEKYAEDYPLEEKSEGFMQLLERFVELVGEGRVLDAGCGPGEETGFFVEHGLEAVGVDAAERMIEQARERNDGDYRVMDLRDLGFDDNVFDGVWCNVTMQFFPPDQMETVLDELDRVLKPGGILYITFKMGEGSIVTEDYGMEVERHLVSEDEARRMLRSRNYDIIETGRSELKWGLEVFNAFCRKHGE